MFDSLQELKDMYEDPLGFHRRPKVLVIEGPDAVGKSTLIKQLSASVQEGTTTKVVAFPGNVGEAKFRDVILSTAMKGQPRTQAALFLANFIYTMENEVAPYWYDINVKFIFDRFFPSTSVYQSIPVTELYSALGTLYPQGEFFFNEFVFAFLHPGSLTNHRTRMENRDKSEINHLDPESWASALKQIETYRRVLEDMPSISGSLCLIEV